MSHGVRGGREARKTLAEIKEVARDKRALSQPDIDFSSLELANAHVFEAATGILLAKL